MRITITLSDENGLELFTQQTVAPNDGTAIDRHLDNAAADVKDALLRAGISAWVAFQRGD